MAQVWFARHAESAANVGEATSDPARIPLTPRGHEQAQALSLVFNAPLVPSRIVTSPFSRTEDTARPTKQRFPEALTEVWPIHEFTYLSPETCVGTTAQDRRARVLRYWEENDPDYVDGKGAESFNQVTGRVDNMLVLAERGLDHPLTVVFCHGLIIALAYLRMSHSRFKGADLMRCFYAHREAFPVPNVAIMKTDITPQGLRLRPDTEYPKL